MNVARLMFHNDDRYNTDGKMKKDHYYTIQYHISQNHTKIH